MINTPAKTCSPQPPIFVKRAVAGFYRTIHLFLDQSRRNLSSRLGDVLHVVGLFLLPSFSDTLHQLLRANRRKVAARAVKIIAVFCGRLTVLPILF